MNFLTPLAFALAALLPVIVALYFLKLRREERVVSSTYLWQEMVRDVAANAPWQRLRPSWLLLLQLLFLAVLILSLARPFSWTVAAAGGHLILIVDTSASMQAGDVSPSRLGVAVDQARRLVGGLPAGTPVTLIAAGQETQVLVSGSRDRGRIDQALGGLRAGVGGSDMATALELAAAVAAGDPEAQVVVISDGGVTLPSRIGGAAQVRYLPVGESAENQAIGALALTPGTAGQGATAFVRIANYGRQAVERRVTLRAHTLAGSGEGTLVAARDLALPAGDSVGLTIADLPPDVAFVEARLEGEDALALDDQAWAVMPIVSGAQVQIVGPGNRFLETALALLPGVEVTTISLEEYEEAWGGEESFATDQPANWLTIFDAVLPAEGHYPPGALLFVGPLRSTAFFSVTGMLEAPTPRPASASDPLLRYVDLRQVAIRQAARLDLPVWGRPVVIAPVEGSGEAAPLLVVGDVDGRRVGVLTFDLRQSDLPLQVAFPLLLANLVDFLAPSAAGALPAMAAPGQVLTIPLPPQVSALSILRPDGVGETLPAIGGEVLYADTATPGVYAVFWEAEGRRGLLGHFAVNVFSPLESNIAPRGQLTLAGGGGQAVAAERPVRQEWWAPLAWVALALLVLEWMVQYRGALAWVWGVVRAAFGRPGCWGQGADLFFESLSPVGLADLPAAAGAAGPGARPAGDGPRLALGDPVAPAHRPGGGPEPGGGAVGAAG